MALGGVGNRSLLFAGRHDKGIAIGHRRRGGEHRGPTATDARQQHDSPDPGIERKAADGAADWSDLLPLIQAVDSLVQYVYNRYILYEYFV
jgi:hypothetical protein